MDEKFISKKSMESILQKVNTKLTGKVDKIDNKGLSSNDFTDEYKNTLDNLNNLPDSLDLMKKSDYASDNNENSVKKADEAIIIESMKNAQPGMYYGTNQDGEVGAYRLPFSEDTKQSGIYQMILLNPPVNSPQAVESIFDLNECKIFVQAYKFVAGDQDVIAILKEFNNANKDSFFYDSENVDFENGMKIKNIFNQNLNINANSLYESDTIIKSEFINGLEVI